MIDIYLYGVLEKGTKAKKDSISFINHCEEFVDFTIKDWSENYVAKYKKVKYKGQLETDTTFVLQKKRYYSNRRFQDNFDIDILYVVIDVMTYKGIKKEYMSYFTFDKHIALQVKNYNLEKVDYEYTDCIVREWKRV